MQDLKPSRVTIDGVPLAATAPVAWRFQTGSQPYVGVYSVHKKDWTKLEPKLGQEVSLSITSSQGETIEIKKLLLLHIVPTDNVHRVSFALADVRFLWPRKVIRRNYNVPVRGGTRTAFGTGETQTVVDNPAYKATSMKRGKPWTAREALEDVLDEVAEKWQIDSWPLAAGRDDIDIQDVHLADSGDVCIETLLGYIPGSSLWIDADGVARVVNSTDLQSSDNRWIELETRTVEGEPGDFIDRTGIRPQRVTVFFERELEVLLHARDNWQATQSSGDPNEGYLENVLPTVDLETEVDLWNPRTKATERVVVPPGTWVPVKAWLEAMDRIRPSSSYPWTFETLRELWIVGDLEGALGARFEVDDNVDGKVSERVAALRQHFRQTWRLSQLWMDRIERILPIRAGLFDPFSQTRQPASVWGECCYVLGPKGSLIADASDPASGDVYSNRTWRTRIGKAPSIVQIEPSQAVLSILDEHLGIFRIDYKLPANGTVDAIIPCNTTNGPAGSSRVGGPWRDLREQDRRASGPGYRIDGNEAGVLLRDRLDFWVLLTIIPAAPNHKTRLHSLSVEPGDLMLEFGAANYSAGEGPTLEVYVPPSQATARFAWQSDGEASATLVDLLNLNSQDPGEELTFTGDAERLPGFQLVNEEPELRALARGIAAEQLLPYADAMQGNVVTVLRPDKANLVGAMSAVEIQVAPHPSGAVRMVHGFPGYAAPVSRFAFLPASARKVLLRTVGAEL